MPSFNVSQDSESELEDQDLEEILESDESEVEFSWSGDDAEEEADTSGEESYERCNRINAHNKNHQIQPTQEKTRAKEETQKETAAFGRRRFRGFLGRRR